MFKDAATNASELLVTRRGYSMIQSTATLICSCWKGLRSVPTPNFPTLRDRGDFDPKGDVESPLHFLRIRKDFISIPASTITVKRDGSFLSLPDHYRMHIGGIGTPSRFGLVI